jgi:hypothetical protein
MTPSHTVEMLPPSFVFAWAIWTNCCIDVGGGVNGLAKWGIPPAPRTEAMANPDRNQISYEYYRRIDALSDEKQICPCGAFEMNGQVLHSAKCPHGGQP